MRAAGVGACEGHCKPQRLLSHQDSVWLGSYRHDGQSGAKVRGIVEHPFPLMQCFKDKLELAIVQVEHCLLQIAHPSMHQLGALGGCARCKVLSLHQGCPQAPAACMRASVWRKWHAGHAEASHRPGWALRYLGKSHACTSLVLVEDLRNPRLSHGNCAIWSSLQSSSEMRAHF